VELQPTDLFHAGLAEGLQIPKAFYDRLRGEDVHKPVAHHVVNHLLGQWKTNRLVRTFSDGGNGGTARALLSDTYRPLDNIDLADAVLPVLTESGCEVKSCELTENRMYIKAVRPELTREVRTANVNEVVSVGVTVSNSEVGKGALKVQPFVFILRCTNGMVVNQCPDIPSLNQYHSGGRLGGDDGLTRWYRDDTRRKMDETFFSQVRDVTQGVMSEFVLKHVCDEIERASGNRIPSGELEPTLDRVAKRWSLSQGERSGVLEHLAGGGDLSQWGLTQSITRAAQDVESYDRASELEALGGVVLSLPASQWGVIANSN
jgi:hypothetical protein